MAGIICIKLYGDINFDSEEERILKFLDRQKIKYEFMSYGDD
jgi:hypothetical protein